MVSTGAARYKNSPSANQSLPSATRVALVSDRWLSPAEWEQRGMTLWHLPLLAFERLLTDAPDAIVLEPAAADPSQIANCWQLHALAGVPLIVLAEGSSSSEVVALLERGAADVVTESPRASILASRVAAILRRSHGRTLQQAWAAERTLTVLHLDDADVDLSSRIVHRPGSSQTLSRTEFNLLEALLNAGGRVCSHAELVTRVWGAQCASATHYLRLYVRYLRQKIERDPLQPRHILNVRGIGYRLAFDPDAGRCGTEGLPATATNAGHERAPIVV